jgi:hypothetical protein
LDRGIGKSAESSPSVGQAQSAPLLPYKKDISVPPRDPADATARGFKTWPTFLFGRSNQVTTPWTRVTGRRRQRANERRQSNISVPGAFLSGSPNSRVTRGHLGSGRARSRKRSLASQLCTFVKHGWSESTELLITVKNWDSRDFFIPRMAIARAE